MGNVKASLIAIHDDQMNVWLLEHNAKNLKMGLVQYKLSKVIRPFIVPFPWSKVQEGYSERAIQGYTKRVIRITLLFRPIV